MRLDGQKVLLVGLSGWPLPNLKSGVEALGGTLERYLLSYSMARPRWSDGGRAQAARNQGLREFVSAMKPLPSLAVFFTYDDCLEPETLRYFRKLGIFTVCYHVDMLTQWYRVLRTGPHFDLVAASQKCNIAALRSHGIRAEFIPMAAPQADTEAAPECENVIGYLGGPQYYRLWMLKRLSEHFPMRYYGRWFPDEDAKKDRQAGFVPDPALSPEPPSLAGSMNRAFFNARYVPAILRHSPYVLTDRFRTPRFGVSAEELKKDWRGPVAQEDMARTMARSFLNIGFTYFSGVPGASSERRQCRLREFEGPLQSLQGPYLMQAFPELDDLYEKDEEVIVWDSFDELVSKARALFADPASARRIAEKGRLAVRARHLWSHRIEQILSYRRR